MSHWLLVPGWWVEVHLTLPLAAGSTTHCGTSAMVIDGPHPTDQDGNQDLPTNHERALGRAAQRLHRLA